MIDAGLPVRASFTSRAGGTSAEPYNGLNLSAHVGDDASSVDANRAELAATLGCPVVYVHAEHGVRVHRVTDAAEVPPPADVLITDVPGIALAALAADCVPVLFHDAATGAVAAAHVGRRGLWKGVVDAAVAALLDLRPAGASRDLISASVGPAICGHCYEVPAEMRLEMGERHPSAVSVTRWGTPAIDIPRGVESRLGELGIQNIIRDRHCTFEDPEFFSHRRDGVTGRQAGVVVCGVSLRGGQGSAT